MDAVHSFVPSKPSFATQSGALLRKNIRYQKKNWCVASRRSGAPPRLRGRHHRGASGGPRRRLACSALTARARAGKPTAAWC
jgi:hypothetical protein